MNNYENELIKKLNEHINQMKTNIKENINNTYLELIKKKQDLNIQDIENWKNSILISINSEIEKLIGHFLRNKEKDKLNEINNKIDIKIDSKSKLNGYTSKDIQEENKEITRKFQNEAFNYMNVNEKVENENIALFLKDVAKISRISFNLRKKLFEIMKEKYLNSKGNTNIIINEDFQKDFSCWIKDSEKEKGKKDYENILNEMKIFEKNNIKEGIFLMQLLYDLTIMYFHCDISFPSVEISFEKEDNFNSDKMIDFINRGKNRKVNFIILPSLISNGNFLQNGKSWVFTFTNNSFKFDDLSLNELINLENPVIYYIKENLQINAYCESKGKEKIVTITTNIDIPENIDYEFIFYLKNKNNVYKKKIKKKTFKFNMKDEIKKYEFKLGDETIISNATVFNK